MCITTETMNEIESSLIQFHQLSNNPIPMLKDCFPEMSFLRMSASDFDEAPFRSLANYDLFLLDGREHCVQLTKDLSVATAVVVAQK